MFRRTDEWSSEEMRFALRLLAGSPRALVSHKCESISRNEAKWAWEMWELRGGCVTLLRALPGRMLLRDPSCPLRASSYCFEMDAGNEAIDTV